MLAHAGPGSWVFFDWTLEPLLVGGLLLVAVAWLLAVHRVDAAHPRSPVSTWRSIAFLGGLLTLFVALASPIDTFADDLFSVHMLQHVLISFVSAPLLVLGAPGTLLLRVASPAARRTILIPVLHSRVVRVLTFPLVTWLLFAVVMWVAHFSPIFELALESDTVHQLEHLAFLASGFLYWLPAIGSDPLPWRLGGSGRLLYLFLGMPQSSVLGLVIVSQTTVMYHHYIAAGALADQRLAGTVMWIGADVMSFVLIGVAGWQWLRTEARRAQRQHAAPLARTRPD
jgi:putative copper resistance protein D